MCNIWKTTLNLDIKISTCTVKKYYQSNDRKMKANKKSASLFCPCVRGAESRQKSLNNQLTCRQKFQAWARLKIEVVQSFQLKWFFISHNQWQTDLEMSCIAWYYKYDIMNSSAIYAKQVSKGFGPARTERWLKQQKYPTTNMWVSCWLPFTVAKHLSLFILIHSKGNLTLTCWVPLE